MENEIKYFSMFTGVGGFELGIGDKAECVGFSEIDKYASQLLAAKFPKVRNYGDATKINASELPDFDMLCGGFPCQSFSIAGKRRGFEDTRGTMFFEVARILEVKRPKIIFLENVKGLLNHNKGETFRVIIQTLSELGYDVQWMVLNSKFFGVPQNRERVFIIGNLRGKSRSEILPFRKVCESFDEQSNSHTLPSSYSKITRGTTMVDESENKMLWFGRDVKTGKYSKNPLQEANRVYDISGIIQTCKSISLKISLIKKSKSQHSRIYRDEGLSPTLAGASKLSGDCTPKIAIPVLTPDREEKKQNGRRFKENGEESFTLTGQDIHGVMLRDGRYNRSCLRSGRNTEVGFSGMSIRRLTPVECERLQGFPDYWTKGFSDTQRYKMMGNAVTTKVIKAIAERLL